MSIVQRAEAAEHAMAQELDRLVVKSTIYVSGEHDPRQPVPRPPDAGRRYMMMGDDPRLPKMPDRPTLFDFFRLRLGPTQHPLQSARLAVKNGAVQDVERIAHKSAGASATCGMNAIVPHLRELERQGHAGSLSDASALVAQADQELERIRAFLNHLQRS